MTDKKIILYFFADYIKEELGIIYKDENLYQLEHRLDDICRQQNLEDLEALYQKAQVSISGDLKVLLLDIATNNETSFYRDKKVFSTLTDNVIPEVIQNKSEITIWSAASSFGQEIYTLVLEIEQLMKRGKSMPKINFMASDISTRALERAKNGIYSQLEVQRGLPTIFLIEYFDKINDKEWQLKDVYRKKVKFFQFNLLDNFNVIPKCDIILCRNVLIYQNTENKCKIVDKLYEKLCSDGFLFLGAAESLFGVSEKFEQRMLGKSIGYQKK